LAELRSGRFLAQSLEESLLLVFWQKSEESHRREQQRFRISMVSGGPGQEVRADHFPTVASGSVTSQHQSRRVDRFLNDRHWLSYSLKK